ncbi:MAG: hypothetical protein NXI20_11925 [bacterium]|nr:hypothetical protein [bacterium]
MSKKINIEELKRDKPVYKVPDGYFEGLTSKIQERIKEEEEVAPERVWVPRLAWATPILVIAISIIYLMNVGGNQPESVEDMLTSISNEELIEYLDMTDVPTDEILASVDGAFLEEAFSNANGETDILNDINEEDLDGILDSYDLNEEFL